MNFGSIPFVARAVATAGGGGAALVQSSPVAVGGYPSASVSFTDPPTVGNTVIVTGVWNPVFGTPPTGIAVADNQGGANTWSVAVLRTQDGNGAWIAYSTLAAASGTYTITATQTGGSADAGASFEAQEWSGLDGTLDRTGNASFFSGGADAVVSASGANSGAARLVVAVASRTATVANNPPLASYTEIYTRLSGDGQAVAAYKTVSAVETSSANFGAITSGSGASALVLATFGIAP